MSLAFYLLFILNAINDTLMWEDLNYPDDLRKADIIDKILAIRINVSPNDTFLQKLFL